MASLSKNRNLVWSSVFPGLSRCPTETGFGVTCPRDFPPLTDDSTDVSRSRVPVRPRQDRDGVGHRSTEGWSRAVTLWFLVMSVVGPAPQTPQWSTTSLSLGRLRRMSTSDAPTRPCTTASTSSPDVDWGPSSVWVRRSFLESAGEGWSRRFVDRSCYRGVGGL